ncbi:MAG: hypothetical protein CEN89_140 [Candidatus Berkelbacteria bacterium Licking1014_7]|uniref:Uncharacterized protein n=1 Tax=Candidatus Berkelbacteria bacterium Licking1014_7 TaxID=2017147 RepID=A0A554LKI4_9BACT|nr:MAG: hypothetical protein CEN89_140 [Candidatus Berkelbacteria bacterium Licking1014_7]
MFRRIISAIFSTRKKVSLFIVAVFLVFFLAGIFIANLSGRLNIFGDSSATTGTFSGIVIDTATDKPIKGAEIILKSTTRTVKITKLVKGYCIIKGKVQRECPITVTTPWQVKKTTDVRGKFNFGKIDNITSSEQWKISVIHANKILLDDFLYLTSGENKIELQIGRIPALSSIEFFTGNNPEKQIYPFTEFGSLEGNAIPNSIVIASPSDTNTKELFKTKDVSQQIETIADDKGRFVFDKIPIGKYSVNSIFDDNNIFTDETEITKGKKSITNFTTERKK